MTDQATQLLHDYLQAIHERHPVAKPPYVYGSQADLLLQHGQWFQATGNHPRYARGSMRFCFFNARRETLRHAGELRYFEGYAVSHVTGLPHPHAWVVDRQDQAWDVTWPVDGLRIRTALVGVYVPIPVLTAHWRTCGGASMLGDYYHDHPVLQHRYAAWQPDLVEHLQRLRDEHCMAEVQAGKVRLLADGSMLAYVD